MRDDGAPLPEVKDGLPSAQRAEVCSYCKTSAREKCPFFSVGRTRIGHNAGKFRLGTFASEFDLASKASMCGHLNRGVAGDSPFDTHPFQTPQPSIQSQSGASSSGSGAVPWRTAQRDAVQQTYSCNAPTREQLRQGLRPVVEPSGKSTSLQQQAARRRASDGQRRPDRAHGATDHNSHDQ